MHKVFDESTYNLNQTPVWTIWLTNNEVLFKGGVKGAIHIVLIFKSLFGNLLLFNS